MSIKSSINKVNQLIQRFYNASQDNYSLERLGALVGLSLLIFIFSTLSPTFREFDNLIYLAKTAAITFSLVSLGQTVVLISGGIDLSVSSVIALTGLITAFLCSTGFAFIPPLTGDLSYIAILIAWFVGACIGAGQGWLITKRKIPPFIVTLATMLGLRGLTIGISGAVIYGLPDNFRWMTESQIGFLPMPVIIMLAIYISTAYTLRKTKIGRYCYAIGGNETAARLAGIDVDRYRIYFYAYSGLLAAITGTLLVSHLNVAIYSHGDGYQFTSVAAAVIGGTSLSGGIGGIWGTVIGVAILAIIPSGLIMLNAPSWSRDVVTSVIIILAVMIDVERSHARKKEIQIEASQSVTTSRYLNDILEHLAKRIEKYIGTTYFRLYLVDQDTGDLVPHESFLHDNTPINANSMGKSQIALEAQQNGTAVLIQDLTRNEFNRVKLMNTDIQSALALPLFNREHCIGVIELQSPGISALKEDSIDVLSDLARPLLTQLEDAWLFESGWLIRQLRDALRHLWDDLYLGRLKLAAWALSEPQPNTTTGEKGQSLRELLVKSIEALKPEESQAISHNMRIYRILQLTYVEEQAIEQIINTLHISRRQYFYDLKDSIEVLTDHVARSHH
ncbi:MAG: GAF domain-containing protein [Anaerolineae bacterium]|nr:GAF domain-containing protein [Anaerolineae bacterium]